MTKTYGVEDFARLADLEVASARVMLRKVGAKKKGRNYEFSGKEEMQKIIDKARAGKSKKEVKKPVKKAKAKTKPSPKKKVKHEGAEASA